LIKIKLFNYSNKKDCLNILITNLPLEYKVENSLVRTLKLYFRILSVKLQSQ